MDPVSCVTLAAGAYKTLKAAISTGKDLHDMGSTLKTWGQAFSDFQNLEQRTNNPPWWRSTFKGSDSETAIEIVAHRKKMEAMRDEIKEHITWHYGKSAWDEVVAIEATLRRQRKEEIYRKQEFIDNCINWAVGLVCFVLGAAVLGGGIYALGKMKDRW